MSTYKNLSHASHKGTHGNEALPLYRPLDSLVGEGVKHKRTVLSVAVVIVSLALIYLGMNAYQDLYQSKAAEFLKKGEPKIVIEKYSRSDAAILAHIKLGEEALKNEKYDDAIRYYEPLSQKKALPAVLRVGASQNLALAYLKKGQADLALDILKKISLDPENAHPDYAKLLEAHVWEVKGDMVKSQEIYKQLSEGAVSNEIKQEAKAHLPVAEVPASSTEKIGGPASEPAKSSTKKQTKNPKAKK